MNCEKCYDILNCPFNKGEVPANIKCPPFEFKIGCWEYDWIGLYNKMPDGEEKLQWRNMMIEKCMTCEVYFEHKIEMDRILEQLKNE